MSHESLFIQNIRVTQTANVSRLIAEVDGFTVWYESTDIELQPRGEVFASAFLLPAMKSGRGLQIQGASLSSLWLSNVRQLMKTFNAWWGYSVVEITCEETTAPEGFPAGNKNGLFFTGGVDSFYTLLTSTEPFDNLIYVHGFDCSHTDDVRLADACHHIAQIATATRCRFSVVKTNLRTHPLMRTLPWTQAHGGALASAGHTLPDIRRLFISSSDAHPVVVPWGSHPEIDPLWSSGQLTFVHYGLEARRLEKIGAIADHPLPQHHLRVCWKNPGRAHNCCRCEKCIRTMLVLESLGKLASFKAFPLQGGLIWRAFHISTIPFSYFPDYRDQRSKCTRWQPRVAIRIMLARSWFRNHKKALLQLLFPAQERRGGTAR